MKKTTGFAERRQHARATVKNIVVGIVNAAEPEIIGSITDISLGGVKFTCNGPKMAPENDPVRTIDLIADENYVFDIPCDCAWIKRIDTENNTDFNGLKQYGIRFNDLTPWQLFQLRGIIDDCFSSAGRVPEKAAEG
jgi:c-di-GMP-binding flagellar brake protein YcgR